MPYETNRLFALVSACALLSGCGLIGHKNHLEDAPAMPSDMGQAGQGAPGGPSGGYPPPPYPPQSYPQQPPQQQTPAMPQAPIPGTVDAALYDEVGYAGWYGQGMGGAPTASGEPFNAGSMGAAHASLPIPSFVEVTNLDTGKTLLVRINDRIQGGRGHLIDLSQGAAAALGMGQRGIAPVRIRRVNPPEDEKTALALGSKGAERLDTPEPLLIALRKKLSTTARPAGPVAEAKPVVRPPVAPRPGRPPVAGPDWNEPGAHYGNEPPRPRPTRPQAPPPQSDDGGYIVENGQRPVRPPHATAPMAGGYFVQIAAMSSQSSAAALARQAGGHVARSGNIWRVRVGPFGSENAARIAQGRLAAKGFRDARITR